MITNICKIFYDFFRNLGSNLDNINDPDKYDFAIQIIIDPNN